MRPSRGMGAMNPDKFKKIKPKKFTDDYKKGGKVGRKRLRTIDKEEPQPTSATSMGKRKKGAENFGNLSKFYKGN